MFSIRWPVHAPIRSIPRAELLVRTCLFIERANGAILLVDDNTPLVHETGLFGVIAGQVDGGKSCLCGGGGGNGGHRSKKMGDCVRCSQTGPEASSIYAGPFESADTECLSLFSHGRIRKSVEMRLVRTHSHRSEHSLH